MSIDSMSDNTGEKVDIQVDASHLPDSFFGLPHTVKASAIFRAYSQVIRQIPDDSGEDSEPLDHAILALVESDERLLGEVRSNFSLGDPRIIREVEEKFGIVRNQELQSKIEGYQRALVDYTMKCIQQSGVKAERSADYTSRLYLSNNSRNSRTRGCSRISDETVRRMDLIVKPKEQSAA